MKIVWPPTGVFLVARKASALVLLKTVWEMSAELLFADRIDISRKRCDTPAMREGFYLWPLQYVREKPCVVSLLEKPSLTLEAS